MGIGGMEHPAAPDGFLRHGEGAAHLHHGKRRRQGHHPQVDQQAVCASVDVGGDGSAPPVADVGGAILQRQVCVLTWMFSLYSIQRTRLAADDEWLDAVWF